MSKMLFMRIVRTDGHEGNWIDYEPASCEGCRFDGRQSADVTPCDQCAMTFDCLYEEDDNVEAQ